jgi:mono/diheme cytochrome c family protein
LFRKGGLILVRPLWLAVALAASVSADESAKPLFERDIAPILSANCWKCHGMENRKAGLDLRTPPLVFRGSDKEPVIVKGSAESSPLFQKISSGAMPPGKLLKLSKEQVELVRRWIDSGAEAARRYDELTKAEAPDVTDKDRHFWAFQQPVRPAVPNVRQTQRISTPIDNFVLAKLEEKKLGFAPPADPRTLIRRAYLDLLGFPPAPEEVDAFEADRSAGAWERLVDRLLANPHFGERWGRSWLDAAGYADVNGIDTNVVTIRAGEGKWRYRDYVVRAFNQDKPYDRFLTEQIAGDEMVDWRSAKKFTPEMREFLIATGFLRNAADDTDNNELNIALIRFRVLQLTIQNVTSNVLGLTVGCAQCHTHKYDPIPQRDYYRMMAIFTPAYNPQSWPQSKDRFLPDVPPAEKQEIDRRNAELDKQVKPLHEQLAAIRKPYEQQLLDKKLMGIPESLRADAKAAVNTPAEKRSDLEKYLVKKLGAMLTSSIAEAESTLNVDDQTKYKAVQDQIRPIEAQRRSYEKLEALYDVGPPPPSYFLRRGNHETPIVEVQPGVLSVLTEPGRSPLIAPSAMNGQTSGRRLAFARWLTEPNTPASGLVARVVVNRIWQQLFGEGIVNPPDNFGHSGALPSHPELLDWLATEFVRTGWHIKPMIKEMMLSSAYTQSSQRTDAVQADAVDPGDRLLWRMRLRRLEAEAIRDSILTASGKIDLTMGGAPEPMDYRPDGMVVVSEKDLSSPTAQFRRSLYMFQRRSFNMTMLSVFDEPVMDTNCTRRNSSAVVLQSLALLNDGFMLDQADFFAQRVAKEAGADVNRRIDFAFRVALGRYPSEKERSWSVESLNQFKDRFRGAQTAPEEANQKAVAALCHTLMNTNEFLYIE